MSLILEAGQKCPYSDNCYYNIMNECFGANIDRKTQFVCEYVINGKIQEGGFRSPLDKTGKMKIIME